MKLLIKLGLTAMIVATLACSTAYKMNRVSLGMEKPQVIDQLGDPQSSKGNGSTEVMVYHFTENGMGDWHEYWVVLTSGKVTTYGKAGDFGTKDPEASKLILELQGK